jgi:hypothetical protein
MDWYWQVRTQNNKVKAAITGDRREYKAVSSQKMGGGKKIRPNNVGSSTRTHKSVPSQNYLSLAPFYLK